MNGTKKIQKKTTIQGKERISHCQNITSTSCSVNYRDWENSGEKFVGNFKIKITDEESEEYYNVLKKQHNEEGIKTHKDDIKEIIIKKNLGKYEKKIYRSQDTTFTYQSKIVDWETDLFRGNQCYLQVTNKLHPQEVKAIFDSLATRKKIIATKSAIGIISTFYKEQNEWAGDTTSMSIDNLFRKY